MTSISNLHRSTSDRMMGGVCGGLADFFQMNSDLVRVGWVLLFLCWHRRGALFALVVACAAGRRNPVQSLPLAASSGAN